MGTCLCDAFFDDVARATVEVLEFLGCSVGFPEGQTCCGQPAFNGGDWKAARKVIRHTVKTFAGEVPIIIPSGSCAHMVHHGFALAMEGEADAPAMQPFSERTWELADYIVNGLGIDRWQGAFPGRIALHRSCHTRGSQTFESARTLLSSIDGLELVAFGEEEQCCGFGGTFSVAFPNISTRMGQLKCSHLLADKPDMLAAVDMACMLHLGGLMDREGQSVPRLHIAQILRDALKNGGLL